MEQEAEKEDLVVLGGHIELTGFSKLERGTLIVLKKIIGNYAKKFSESCNDFQKLSLKMKSVHGTEKSEKYELHGMVIDAGKQYTSEITERNLFFGVDKVFKKIEKMMK